MSTLCELSELAVFDLETTGLDLENDRVVTAHVGRLSLDGSIVTVTAGRDWLVNPGIPIPEAASNVHGVSNERAAADGQDARTAVTEIITLLRSYVDAGIPLTAYNARYDFTILDREARRHGLEPLNPKRVLDPLVIDKNVDKWRKGGRKLVDAMKVYGLELSEEDAHNADADAIAAGRLAFALIPRYSGTTTLDAFHDNQRTWAREQANSYQDYLRRQNPDAYIEPAWPVVPIRNH